MTTSPRHVNGNRETRPAKKRSGLASKPENGTPNLENQSPPERILVIDIGGTKVKMLVSGAHEPRKVPSGKKLTPAKLVGSVKLFATDWEYDAISIGYPGLVGNHGPRSEPGNLGPGWVGFNYAAAFGKPVRIINDAAMQALGNYEGGKMLFLGLGTGLGSTLIADQVIVPMELGNLLHIDGRRLWEVLGRKGLEKEGKDKWREAVNAAVGILLPAVAADYVVLGGGNAKYLKTLPPGARVGHNLTAFRGGFRLWKLDDVPTLEADGAATSGPTLLPVEWRCL
jgi:predicted NBD/HSP70 family sugar kinase